jgi:catechol 2,3-dioxygenase-like lactoylglutathione lyase family enzyme
MALNALLDIELSVPEPGELGAFWERRGMRLTDDGVLGTEDRDVQLRLAEGTYRHLSELHLGCESEQDLADIGARIAAMGVESTIEGTTLRCIDPVLGHRVVIDVGESPSLAAGRKRVVNGPGEQTRSDVRAEAITEPAPRPPRRLGHVVFGTPHFQKATEFFVDGLGFRVSDQILNGVATFARVETDHHNLLIAPAPTGHLNHYALEVDDFDAIGKAGSAVVAEREDASIVGVGRHNLGANLFWYLTDPAGNMFEFFADMDQIVDDEAWERDHLRRDWEGADGPAGFSIWGPKDPPDVFFNQPDLAEIGAAREALGLD